MFSSLSFFFKKKRINGGECPLFVLALFFYYKTKKIDSEMPELFSRVSMSFSMDRHIRTSLQAIWQGTAILNLPNLNQFSVF